MFPVSGALQLKTSGASRLRPISSAMGAYSSVVRPAPSSSSGRKRFQRAARLALIFSLSMNGGIRHLVQSPPWCCSRMVSQ
jgi:hypothetical protein